MVNVLTGDEDAVPATARYYKAKGLPWVVVGEYQQFTVDVVVCWGR